MHQELAEDDDDNGFFPIETMQERVDAIVQSPAELDKWRRIAGWGIEAVRHLDWEKANKWQGGLLELLDLDNDWSVPKGLRLALPRKMGEFVAAHYWDSWAREGWSIVERCFHRSGEMDDSDRRKAERLVAEGQTYWNRNPLAGQPTVLPNEEFDGHWFLGERRWMNDGVDQMIKCLTELLVSKGKRELDMTTIRLLFRSHMSHLATWKASEEGRLAESAQRETMRKKAEEKCQKESQGRNDAENEARRWKKRHDAALGLRHTLDDALKNPRQKAGHLLDWLKSLSDAERSLYDWLMADQNPNKSQTEWGRQQIKKGLPGSKAYVSSVRKTLERKVRDAGFRMPSLPPRSKGGRPPSKSVRGEASGTADDAELRGRLNGQTKTPTKRKSRDD